MLTPVESETLHHEALSPEPALTKQRQRTRADSLAPTLPASPRPAATNTERRFSASRARPERPAPGLSVPAA